MQNDSIDNLRLDLNKKSVRGVIYVRAGDTRARTVHITLVNNGSVVDLSDAHICEIMIRKPNGDSNDQAVDMNEQAMVRYGNELQYTFRTQDINVPGECKCQVMITFNDGAVVTSPEFSVMVYQKVIDQSLEKSTNEYTAVTQQLTEATNLRNQTAQDADRAEAARSGVEEYEARCEQYANDASNSSSSAASSADSASISAASASADKDLTKQYRDDAETFMEETRANLASVEEKATEIMNYDSSAQESAEDAADSAAAAEASALSAESDAEDAEAYAAGTRGGDPVSSDDPAYHNNSKYYSEQAAASAASFPTTLSGFTNDMGFIDKTVNDLVNYYTKSQTYTKTEIDNLIAAIKEFKIVFVNSLPTSNIDTHTLYFLARQTPEQNDYYDEYINTDGTSAGWEKIGSTQIDLSQYYTKTEVDNLIEGIVGIGTAAMNMFTLRFFVTMNAKFNLSEGAYLAIRFPNNDYPGMNKANLVIGNSNPIAVKVDGTIIPDNSEIGREEYVLRAGETGLFVYDGTYLNLIDKNGGSGHTIEDGTGTSLVQEPTLQFPDSGVSDDALNQKTVVEVIQEHSVADYATVTTDGIHVCDDGNDIPIGDIEEDFVSVTGDNVKTRGQLLSELFSKVSLSRISNHAVFVRSTSGSDFAFCFSRLDADAIYFTSTEIRSNADVLTTAVLKASSSNWYYWDGTQNSDLSSHVESESVTYTLYYGSSKAIVNLLTSAKDCMLSDGQTSVESAMAKKSDLTSIVAFGATNATGNAIASGTYFYLNGTLVRAKADIAAGATFTQNTNYVVVTAGALNELSHEKTTLCTMASSETTFQLTQTVQNYAVQHDGFYIVTMVNMTGAHDMFINIGNTAIGSQYSTYVYQRFAVCIPLKAGTQLTFGGAVGDSILISYGWGNI